MLVRYSAALLRFSFYLVCFRNLGTYLEDQREDFFYFWYVVAMVPGSIAVVPLSMFRITLCIRSRIICRSLLERARITDLVTATAVRISE